MRVLFIAKPHLPVPGGAQSTTDAVARDLAARGHEVTVVALQAEGRGDELDESLGYPTLRCARPERAARDMRPDVVVVGGYGGPLRGWTNAMLTGCARLPTVLHLHDSSSAASAGTPRTVDAVVAVSRFVARLARARGLRAEAIPPPVDPDAYRVESTRRVALFVNPVPEKGLDTALALAAARPDVPFRFVRCWSIPPHRLRALRRTARELGNVEVRNQVARPAHIYADARLLVVPSACEEAWGRVVVEAQVSGIPAIASRVGGLPEAVGEGGLLVDPGAGTHGWLDALRSLWDDSREYARLSARAERSASRPELRPGELGSRFERVLLGVAG